MGFYGSLANEANILLLIYLYFDVYNIFPNFGNLLKGHPVGFIKNCNVYLSW